MKTVNLTLVIASLLSVTSASSYAATNVAHTGVDSEGTKMLVADAHEVWTTGKVVRVSTKRGTVTIDHGPIKNLKMMAMTMPFTAEDAALLEGLEAGDVIEFIAEMNGKDLILKKLRKPAS